MATGIRVILVSRRPTAEESSELEPAPRRRDFRARFAVTRRLFNSTSPGRRATQRLLARALQDQRPGDPGTTAAENIQHCGAAAHAPHMRHHGVHPAASVLTDQVLRIAGRETTRRRASTMNRAQGGERARDVQMGRASRKTFPVDNRRPGCTDPGHEASRTSSRSGSRERGAGIRGTKEWFNRWSRGFTPMVAG
jgi:hypothetical protein